MGYPVRSIHIGPGEEPRFDRIFGGGTLVYASDIVTADALVNTGPCIYYGYIVHVATATAAITIEDAVAAGGDVKETIASGTAVGKYLIGDGIGIYCPTGLYINYAAGPATGSVAVLYLPEA